MPAQREELEEDGVPHVWNLEDPYKYAPEKPEGDPWSVLLQPLLEKDKMQCDAWADEVQNLLIFAGLFSSVVTTFVIESYRNLQASPEDAMVSLLSRIAASLDNPNNFTRSITLPIETPAFSPTKSSIRTNTLWFTSLVLSLTTVLVGTISLQWLRQHESYHDLTPKQTYALFHMRSNALRAWHVPKLFTILPLFLQIAVVLFLIGLIEFLLEFGGKTVVIPVSVVIGLTLSFLLCTTALPAFQGIHLYMRRSSHLKHRKVPNQCPYKSPQSYIFRNMCSFFFQTVVKIFLGFRPFANVSRFFGLPISSRDTAIPVFFQDTVPQYLRDTWEPQRTWTQFDLSWLSLRDAYMRSALNRAVAATKIGQRDDQSFPLFDVTRALLRSLRDARSYPSVEYHCVSELSEAIPTKGITLTDNWDIYDTENDYFQELLSEGLKDRYIRIAEFFQFNGPKQFQEMSRSFRGEVRAEKLVKVLRHENIHTFLEHVHQCYPLDKGVQKHKLEIKLRLLGYFYQESHEIRPVIVDSMLHAPSIPRCLFMSDTFRYPSTLQMADDFHFQLGAIILSFFKRVGGNNPPPLPTVIHRHLPQLMQTAGRAIRNYWPTSGTSKDGLTMTFSYATQRLSNELAHFNITEAKPSFLFYLSAIYIKFLVSSLLDPDLRTLLSVIREYKHATIDKGIINSDIEELCRSPSIYGPDIFTDNWWSFLDIYGKSGNRATSNPQEYPNHSP